MMNTTNDESKWKPWKIIPTKHIPSASFCTWHCKADSLPPADCVILENGRKLTITALPSSFELWKQKAAAELAKAEKAKEDRRQRILKEQDTVPDPFSHPDPWANWNAHPPKGKGNQ